MEDVMHWRQKVVDAIVNKTHSQQTMLWPSGFQDYCRKRGIGTSIGTSLLENWDKTGVFHPIYRYVYPTSLHRKISDDWYGWEKEPIVGEPVEGEETVVVIHNGWKVQDLKKAEYHSQANSFITVPNTDNFSSWKDYEGSADNYYASSGGVHYHPFQIFRLRSVTQACNLSCSFKDFQVGSGLEEMYRGDLQRALDQLRKNEIYELKVLYVLALIEDRYLPKWRGDRKMITVNSTPSEQNGETWHEWAARFDAKAVFESCGFTIEELQKMRFNLAFHGQNLDANQNFYLLFRHFAYKDRQRLKGDALLAWDYYEASELLGWFIEDVTGVKQPKTDDLNGFSSWKKVRYGIEPQDIDYDEGNILQLLLKDYAIDPTPKVLLVVEGESESSFIRTWCEERQIDLELKGIRLLVLEGIPGLNSKTTKQALAQAKVDEMAVIVVVDRDGEDVSRKRLDEWIEEGLIPRIFTEQDLQGTNSPQGGMIWEPCFEDANFSLQEQVEAWLALAREKQDVKVDAKEVQAAIEKILSELQFNRTGEVIEFANNIKAMGFVHRRYGLPKLSDNKTGFGRHLALLHGDKVTPMMRVIEHCIRMALLANLYGSAQPDGGFGKPIE